MKISRPQLAGTVLALASGFLVPVPGARASGHPSPVVCRGDHFSAFGENDPRPVKAVGLPKLTSGYAPRCLVADSVAGIEVDAFGDFRLLRTEKVTGARWSAGVWYLSYHDRETGAPIHTGRGTIRGADVIARHGRAIVSFGV